MKNRKSPAEQSAEQAEAVRAKEEEKQQESRVKREKESEERWEKVKLAAEKLAPFIYEEYKKKIAEAAASGRDTCSVDHDEWKGNYYGEEKLLTSEEKKIEDEKVFQSNVKNEAQKIAQKKLKDEGYTIEQKGDSGDTQWGPGSDSIAVAGWSKSWLEISFSKKNPKKKKR